MVFLWGLFFEVLILKGLFLVCLALCSKCLFFQVLGVFLGWLIVVHLGLEGLGVLCFLCLFFFFVLLLFLFCLLCSWFCGWMLLFCFFVVFFGFVFFGGFKGQVRWPEGPPHLALNPSYFICFCFFCFSFVVFSFFFFFVFLFVFFGGFKGQVRWPKGPPHLALNPPYLICFCFFCFLFFFFCSLVFAFARKKNLFSPLNKAFLCIF